MIPPKKSWSPPKNGLPTPTMWGIFFLVNGPFCEQFGKCILYFWKLFATLYRLRIRILMDIKNTLVIGGAGYIGSCLARVLVEMGREVTLLGRKIIPEYSLPPEARYVAGDFGDMGVILPLLDQHQEVVHLAHSTIPGTAATNPFADLMQNLPPAVRLFEEIAKRNGRLVLVSSGGTVYGEASALPVSERHATQPISAYGLVKLTLENYARLYAGTDGLQYVCVRPANAFGAGQRVSSGQGFISAAIANVMRSEPVTIFGDCGTVRDYIYVSDVAYGIACALESGHPSETYNLGSGVGRSNMDVVKMMVPLLEQMGFGVNIRHLPERSFDVRVNILDSTKIQNHTGWQPKIDFAVGLKLTADRLKALHG